MSKKAGESGGIGLREKKLWCEAGCPEVMVLKGVKGGKRIVLIGGEIETDAVIIENAVRKVREREQRRAITHVRSSRLNDREGTHTKVATRGFSYCSVCLKRISGKDRYCGKKCEEIAGRELFKKLLDFE